MFSEKSLHCYGTSLPLLELDQVPSKRPLHVQDQIATDEQGRRRFHGAFTGGFSAGYWNTVGSKEGWTPAQFKSSRTEKAAERFKQCPEDFMDEEDKGVFGIAPKGLKINEDYSVVEQEVKRKRKLPTGQEPIPGEPVLSHLIKPIKDNVSVRILKTWGWRPGQGIGPRQSRQEKKKTEERNKRELYLIENYGCELPNTSGSKPAHSDESDTEDDGDMDDITFAPEDYDMPPCSIKQNRYSLGYQSLNRTPVLRDATFEGTTNERFNLFQPLEMLDKSNQRISFTGQAFGVGALEDDDDEDIFAKDDMTRYDFTLEDKKEMKKKRLPQPVDKQEVILGEFLLNRNLEKVQMYTVEMPFGWQPRNWLKKRNRFEPLEPHRAKQLEKKFEQMNQQQELSRKQRADALGEKVTPNTKPSLQAMQDMYKERQKKTKDLLEKISSKSQNFTKGGIITEQGEEQAIVESEDNESSSTFKPFLNDAHKQKRYDQFLQSQLLAEEDIEELLNKIQPKEMSFWDKRTELKEFIQARKLYQPLKGTIADRFITETAIKKENKVDEKQTKETTTEVKVERLTKMWKPNALLCKRYNIPEPYGGHMKEELQPKKHKKISVFDYLETSVNKKEDFRTPQIFTKLDTEEQQHQQQQQQPQQQQQQPIVEESKCKEESVPFIETNTLAKNNNKLIKGFVAKTNLEKQVVESLDKPAPEKKELFKAIFSDDEEDEEEKIVRDEDNHKTLLAPSLNVTAAAANLLRNNSPPRGIFKALFSFDPATPNPEIKDKKIEEQKQQSDSERSSKQERITFQPRNKQQNGNENDIKVIDTDIEMYGPALPIKTVQITSSITNTSDSIKTHQTNRKENEIWVEKSIIDRDQDSNSTLSSNDELSSSSKRKRYKLKKTKKTKDNKKSHRKLKKHGKKHKKSKK